MAQALKEAKKAFSEGEVPVGAVLASPEGEIVAKAHNQTISRSDPTAHAEILVIRRAGEVFKNYRLNHTLLAVTIEPCAMCMGAAINARVGRLVFGAADPKAGAAESLYHLGSDHRLNHQIEITSGVMEMECRTLMQEFFRARRDR